jgi:RNA polymerase sigma factor (sigma-70 family)
MKELNGDPVDPLETRPSLLQRIQNTADEESWREFYGLYSGLVHRFAMQRGLTETEARDVVQETFMVVAKVIPEFRYNPSLGSFRSWLLHTTQWRICDQYNKRGPQGAARFHRSAVDDSRTRTVDRIADDSFAHLQNVWDREWQQNLVEAALQRVKAHINSKQFQIFDLYVLKNWPVTKVARALNVSVGGVYLTKHRVAKHIKEEIKQLESEFN